MKTKQNKTEKLDTSHMKTDCSLDQNKWKLAQNNIKHMY